MDMPQSRRLTKDLTKTWNELGSSKRAPVAARVVERDGISSRRRMAFDFGTRTREGWRWFFVVRRLEMATKAGNSMVLDM